MKIQNEKRYHAKLSISIHFQTKSIHAIGEV